MTTQAARRNSRAKPSPARRAGNADRTNSADTVGVIVLAAGEGTRMRSSVPKVAHPVCGTAMVTHVVRVAGDLHPRKVVVVVGHGAQAVKDALADEQVEFAEQPQRLGTGDAVARARPLLGDCDPIVVLNGDGPLLLAKTLHELVAATGKAPVAILTCELEDAGKLGRVLRNSRGEPTAIVEAADYKGGSEAAEVNTGQYAFRSQWLWDHVDGLPLSRKGEYYLTGLVAAAAREGRLATTIVITPEEGMGVDDRVRLAEAEGVMRRRILERLMSEGVTITDPATTYVDADVVLGKDVTVYPGCHLLGKTAVAARCVIGPGTVLRNATILEDVRIDSSVIEDSRVGARTRVGPFAHVRAGASIGEDCELGNYSEVKNSVIGHRVKMHHFSFVGDADVGDEANIAAGVITCNFDGREKHRTVIGKGAFVGSDTLLVAPVKMGDRAMTGAGTVVNRDLPAGARAVGAPARLLPPKAKGTSAARRKR